MLKSILSATLAHIFNCSFSSVVVPDKLKKNNHISWTWRQYGFRSNHSTCHALLLMTNKIQKAIEDGMFACGIFLDLKRHLIQLTTIFY
jgi:hypothetical protein